MASKDRIPRLIFFLACAFFVFLFGFASSQFHIWPYSIVSGAFEQASSVFRGQQQFHWHHLHPVRYSFSGARTHGEAATPQGGLTLLTSYWPEHDGAPGIRLVDTRGETLHSWNADPARIWPESPYTDSVAGLFNVSSNYIHGSFLFANGDVLFNIEYLGLVRLDANGDVVWRLDRRTHHSVCRDDDGNFWVCGARWIETPEQRGDRFPGLELPIAEDLAIKVSPDGEVLHELSILDIVFGDPELRRLVFREGGVRTGDIVHANDVDPLPSKLADSYPLFEAGDVAISMRTIDLVVVVDPASGVVKWSADAPFTGQHDPDFIGDGWISVFDNRPDGTAEGRHLGGSRLVQLRPHTGEVRTAYPSPNSSSFSTQRGGKAQLLENGHWLVTESQAARVFEIDADGRTVWEWAKPPERSNASLVAEVLEGTRYSLAPAAVAAWSR